MPEPQRRPLCPFYGFRWPNHTSRLFRAEGSECGLDLDRHGPCQMELRQNRIDFDSCEVRSSHQHLLHAGRHHIRFHAPELPSNGLTLDDWKDRVLRGK